MDPSNDQTAGTQVPVEGQVPVPAVPELDTQATANPGSPPITPGQVPASQMPQLAPMTTIPLPVPATKSQPATTVNQTSGFQVADDKDVIEPEWVHKAKAIVGSTSDDPYKQSEELTILKADYMQKRYNKIVKLK
jgi:hypothetical protein